MLPAWCDGRLLAGRLPCQVFTRCHLGCLAVAASARGDCVLAGGFRTTRCSAVFTRSPSSEILWLHWRGYAYREQKERKLMTSKPKLGSCWGCLHHSVFSSSYQESFQRIIMASLERKYIYAYRKQKERILMTGKPN